LISFGTTLEDLRSGMILYDYLVARERIPLDPGMAIQ
jgi:hypothetical protein